MGVSAHTIGLLVDAGLSGKTLTELTAAIEADIESACAPLRVTCDALLRVTSVTGRNAVTDDGLTPAAFRMRKMRAKARVEREISVAGEGVTGRNTVTSQSVTPDISLSSNLSSSSTVIGIEESKGKGKGLRAREQYSPEFQNLFWAKYPVDPNMSKKEAYAAWCKVSPEERQQVIDSMPMFSAWLAKQPADYRPLHACRYISQRRFEGHLNGVSAYDASKAAALATLEKYRA